MTFIVPDVDDDMHDGTIQEGDDWAEKHLEPLLKWAATHDTLVIFTWDEGYDRVNSIPTMFVGPMVKAGQYTRSASITSTCCARSRTCTACRTRGGAADVAPITNVWR